MPGTGSREPREHPREGAREGDWQERAAAVVDASAPGVSLPTEIVGELFAHAVECYPEECCGLVLGSPPLGLGRVLRCTNVQDRQLRRGESTLDAKRAFWIDEYELLEASRAAETSGEEILIIYHSHVDAPAYFSQQDLRGALGPQGTPLWPHAAQLVIAVHEGVVSDAALFEWQPRAGRYRGRRLLERV